MPNDRFWLYKIFKEDPKVTISEASIAKLYGITLEEVSEYIQRDLQAKMIEREWSCSTFYLTSRGFEFLFFGRKGSNSCSPFK